MKKRRFSLFVPLGYLLLLALLSWGCGGDKHSPSILEKWERFEAGNPALEKTEDELVRDFGSVARRSTHLLEPEGGATAPVEPAPPAPGETPGAVDDAEDSETPFPVRPWAYRCFAPVGCADDDALPPGLKIAPVMEHNGIPVAESRHVYTTDEEEDSDEPVARLDVRNYGGWLEYTAFLVSFTRGCLVGTAGCSATNPDFPRMGLFVDTSVFGAYSGTTPGGRGSATWTGVMVAGEDIKTDTGSPESDLFFGDAQVRIDNLAAPDVDVSLTNIHNVTGKTTRPGMTWQNLPVEDGLFGRGSGRYDENGNLTGDYIVGMFNGPGHEEVGGRFSRGGLVGAFGAKRR